MSASITSCIIIEPGGKIKRQLGEKLKTAGIALNIIPDDLHEVMQRFVAGGFEVWLVGGALRDMLLGLPPQDWDLASSASPEEVMRLFPRVVPIGFRHGTVQVHTRVRSIEVTSCAGAGLQGIRADLQRRDFTINALALTYPDGLLLDPFRGREDLATRTLRAVENASARFREDPLRTLRAGRFSSVYGFKIEPLTFAALQETAPRLQGVAWERIRDEFFKMLLGRQVRKGFAVLIRGGILPVILPELTEDAEEGTDREEALEHLINSVAYSPRRIQVRLAALFHHLAEGAGSGSGEEEAELAASAIESAQLAQTILKRWCASRNLTRQVVALVAEQVPEGVEAWRDGEVRRFLAQVGRDQLDDVLALARADRMARRDRRRGLAVLRDLQRRVVDELERNPPLQRQDLAVTGRDLMQAFHLPSGPFVGQLLQTLYQYVLEHPACNEYKILMDFLKKKYSLRFQLPPTPEGNKQNQGG